MTADEEIRPVLEDSRLGSAVVMTRIAANMRHVHSHAIAFPGDLLRQRTAHIGPVDVAEHGPKRFEIFEPAQDIEAAPKVPSVPHLIAFREVREQGGIEIAVRI